MFKTKLENFRNKKCLRQNQSLLLSNLVLHLFTDFSNRKADSTSKLSYSLKIYGCILFIMDSSLCPASVHHLLMQIIPLSILATFLIKQAKRGLCNQTRTWAIGIWSVSRFRPFTDRHEILNHCTVLGSKAERLVSKGFSVFLPFQNGASYRFVGHFRASSEVWCSQTSSQTVLVCYASWHNLTLLQGKPWKHVHIFLGFADGNTNTKKC